METHSVCSSHQSAVHLIALPGVVALVEDPSIQKLLGDVLTRRGYRVARMDARRAIDLVESGLEKIDLVITNQPETFFACRHMVPLLYLAAAPDPDMAPRFPHCQVLRKPFHTGHLLAAVRDLTGSL